MWNRNGNYRMYLVGVAVVCIGAVMLTGKAEKLSPNTGVDSQDSTPPVAVMALNNRGPFPSAHTPTRGPLSLRWSDSANPLGWSNLPMNNDDTLVRLRLLQECPDGLWVAINPMSPSLDPFRHRSLAFVPANQLHSVNEDSRSDGIPNLISALRAPSFQRHCSRPLD